MADQFVVQRSETIAASPQDVFAKVGNLVAWDEWSPWAELDPDMTKTFNGEPGTVGSSYTWAGNRKVGQGKMTMSSVVPNEKVEIDLEFIKPFAAQNLTEMVLAPHGDGTEVTWRMTGQMTMMTKIMGFVGRTMDKMVGPDFEKGLAKLKRLSEA